MKQIAYRTGYKYQLAEPYVDVVEIRPDHEIGNRFVTLAPDGTLTVRQDYAFDGPSGPTVDTKDFMRGSLVHDAIYQLMREGHLDRNVYREKADSILRRICIEDGMPHWRAEYVYMGVREFGAAAADPSNDNPVIRAP